MKTLIKIFIGANVVFISLIMLFFCSRYINFEIWSFLHRHDDCRPDSTLMCGVWQAKDGATIELKEDGTCSLRNVQRVIKYGCYVGNDKDTSCMYNYDGYWQVVPRISYHRKDTLGYELHLDSRPPTLSLEERRNWDKGGYIVMLNIHNEKQGKKIIPVMLYDFIGDPDDFETYDFLKQDCIMQ